ncbi:hypothetical protein JW921_05940 [Candidatus Fermentibacterales bacterium]|nr:hypothetical protein [Candidatus Fermentibacterales bacterium]
MEERFEACYDEGYWMVLDRVVDYFVHADEGPDGPCTPQYHGLVCGSRQGAEALASALNDGRLTIGGETVYGEPYIAVGVAKEFFRNERS